MKNKKIKIVEGGCNICLDKPVITYCKKCGNCYLVNQVDGTRTEIDLTLIELLQLLNKKGKS
jgi:hypothetical protein